MYLKGFHQPVIRMFHLCDIEVCIPLVSVENASFIAVSWIRLLKNGLNLFELKQFSLKRLMLVCDADNKRSRQLILANGGVLEDVREGTERYWVEV